MAHSEQIKAATDLLGQLEQAAKYSDWLPSIAQLEQFSHSQAQGVRCNCSACSQGDPLDDAPILPEQVNSKLEKAFNNGSESQITEAKSVRRSCDQAVWDEAAAQLQTLQQQIKQIAQQEAMGEVRLLRGLYVASGIAMLYGLNLYLLNLHLGRYL